MLKTSPRRVGWVENIDPHLPGAFPGTEDPNMVSTSSPSQHTPFLHT